MRQIGLLSLVLSLASCAPTAQPGSSAGGEQRIARVESGLRRAVQVKGRPVDAYQLSDRMAKYHTPGVTIAVADSGRIVWARGYGVREAGTNDSVTPTTLFEAGSISKPVAATIMLRLMEQGKLTLDENVNDYLTSWKLPENRFTAKEKVTLRRIVSHNAGLTVHGFPGYEVTDSIPTVPQVLDGAKPANTGPVRVDTTPGAIWRYSGGGTTIMQLLVTDVGGKPFPALARELVFDPAGMTLSTYEQPIPASRISETSAAHHQDGTMVPGRWHVYPEMAAAGLWTNPTELLQWAIAIAESRAGQPNSLLKQETATEMLTVQKEPTGLGPFLEGSGLGFNFGHGGADEGFHAQLIYFPETGQGAAVMVNSDGGPPMMQEILYAIAAEYGWPEYGPREIEAVAVDSAAVERALGAYQTDKPVPVTITISRENGKVFVHSEFTPKGEAVFTTPTHLVMLEGGFQLDLVPGPDGAIESVKAGPFVAPKIR
ncbi:MAG: serine hydrolase domain-containing protein [Gemmatimonadales bacterium]